MNDPSPYVESSLIASPFGVLTVLCLVAAFFFWLAQATKAKLFNYVPPLLFIYATPIIMSNTDVIFGMEQKILVNGSPVYSGMREFGLPIAICLMLLSVNVPAAVRVMGGGVAVMLMGTAGVVIGGVFSYWLVHSFLQPDAWKAVGTLATMRLPRSSTPGTRSRTPLMSCSASL